MNEIKQEFRADLVWHKFDIKDEDTWPPESGHYLVGVERRFASDKPPVVVDGETKYYVNVYEIVDYLFFYRSWEPGIDIGWDDYRDEEIKWWCEAKFPEFPKERERV